MTALLETDNSVVYSRIVAARATLANRVDRGQVIDDQEFAKIEAARDLNNSV
jgi:hypothetical protein